MNKIVGAYARVSKIDQHPENQTNELRRYVESRGWTLYNGEPFVDHGISGAKGQDKRPGLKALMEAAHKRKIQVVLVWEWSRFARSTQQLADAADKLRTWGIDFISIQQNVDTTTASGRLTFGFFALIAEYERELIRERTLLGLAEARSNGKTLGRPKAKIVTKPGDTADELIERIGSMSLRSAERFLKEKGQKVSRATLSRWRAAAKVSQKPHENHALPS